MVTKRPDPVGRYRTMELVRTFCFEHNLLGECVKSKDAIGIAFPSGETLGRKGNTFSVTRDSGK